MSMKISKDAITLSELKLHPEEVVERAADTHCPVLVVRGGKAVAVVQSVEDYEASAEELLFAKAVAQGLADIRKNDTVTLEEARKLLGVV